MKNHRRANHITSKSLLHDHKNKLALPNNALKKPSLRTITTRAQVRCHLSPTQSKRTSSVENHPSPKQTANQPTTLATNLFSKSEEETKAEQEEHSEISSIKEIGWTGVIQEYRDQIMGYVLQRQDQCKIDGSYITHGHLITARMRGYLVRHMFKIYHRFDLLRTTLHLAVHYLDLYFAKKILLNDQIEAICISQACLFIAMKYEEIYPPDLKDWVDRKHKSNVLQMESRILTALNYDLSHYTLQNYLNLQNWENGEEIDDDLCKQNLLSDLSLFDIKVRQEKSSEVAKTIRDLCNHQNPSDRHLSLSVKWMVERNGDNLNWLRQQKYGSLQEHGLF